MKTRKFIFIVALCVLFCNVNQVYGIISSDKTEKGSWNVSAGGVDYVCKERYVSPKVSLPHGFVKLHDPYRYLSDEELQNYCTSRSNHNVYYIGYEELYSYKTCSAFSNDTIGACKCYNLTIYQSCTIVSSQKVAYYNEEAYIKWYYLDENNNIYKYEERTLAPSERDRDSVINIPDYTCSNGKTFIGWDLNSTYKNDGIPLAKPNALNYGIYGSGFFGKNYYTFYPVCVENANTGNDPVDDTGNDPDNSSMYNYIYGSFLDFTDDSIGNDPDNSTGNDPDDNTGNNPDNNTGNNPDNNTGNNPDNNTGNNPDNNTGNNPDNNVITNTNNDTGNDKIENPKTGIVNYFGLIFIFPVLLVMIIILKNFKKLHKI